MIHSQWSKYVNLIGPVTVGTTEVTATFDTTGYRYATVLMHLDVAAASSVITSARVSQGDGTSYTAIVAGTGGTATSTSIGYVLPIPNTSTGDMIIHNIDMRGKAKNLKVGFGSTTARLASVVAILSRAKVGPTSATDRGGTVVNY